jgi:hypothetical protein
MFVAGIGLGMSCSKRSGDVSAIANPEYVQPVGHVQGKVVDQCSDLSLEDVEVSIAIKGKVKTVTTDDNGMFAFQNLPVNFGYIEGTNNYDGSCYVVVANFEKYNKKQADAVKKWNKKYPADLHTARPYPDTTENIVCLHYEWIDSADGKNGVITYTGSGAATVVDGLAGEVILYASKPVGTVVGEAYWAKDKTPASGVLLNLYGKQLTEGSDVSYTLEGQAVVGADGTYQFSMVHECRNYTIQPAKPCFVFQAAGTGSANYTGSSFEVLATQLSDPEGDLAVDYVQCIEMNPIPCLDDLSPCLVSSNPKESQDITSPRPAITLTFSELMDETIPVKEEVEIVFAGIKAVLTPPSVDFDYIWSTTMANMVGYPTAQTVSILTLTPTQDLLLGMKYDIRMKGATPATYPAPPTENLSYNFMDLAGQTYSPASSVCSHLGFEAAGTDKKISFTTNYGGTCPPVTNLAQVPKTANAVSQLVYPGVGGPTYLDKNATPEKAQIQAPVLNADYWNPAGGDTTTEYVSDQAVITWTAPGTVTAPVRLKGYRLYGRVNPLDPWTQLANESTLTMYNSIWPTKDPDGALDNTNNLSWINTQLSGAVDPMISDNWGYDKTGKAAQTLQLAVTTVNADGYECPAITSDNSITLKDNTTPMIVRNYPFSSDGTKWGQLATSYFFDTAAAITPKDLREKDTVTLMSMTYPTAGTLPTAWSPSLLACKYGDLPLGIPILEDVTTAISTGVIFSDTSITPENGICQLTFCPGYYTEPNDASDGEFKERKMLSAKNVVYLVWNDAYKIDTGDRLSISGEADIAGNVSADWVHVVDDIPVMMKSVVVDPVLDTITVITTEKVFDDSASVPAAPNYSKFMRRGVGPNGQIELRGLGGDGTPTPNASGQPRLIDPDLDGNYNEHFVLAAVASSVDASSITIKLDDSSYIQQGDFVKFVAMWADDWTDELRGHTQSWDRGRWAYWYGDPLHTGAYAPGTDGIGTLDGVLDNIPPRLSGRNSMTGTAGADDPVMAAGPATGPVRADRDFGINNITFTEPIYNLAASTTNSSEIDNPANYAVRIRDCGADQICGAPSTDDASIVVTCQTAAPQAGNFRANLTCHTPTSPSLRMYQVIAGGASITVTNVKDVPGGLLTNTILGSGVSAHNAVSYVDAVVGPPAVPAHWARN